MSDDDRRGESVVAGLLQIGEDVDAVGGQITAVLVEVLPAGWVVRFDACELLAHEELPTARLAGAPLPWAHVDSAGPGAPPHLPPAFR
jgi:hypothetical protein